MRGLRPTPTAHHIKSKPFISKDLHTCSHAFLRSDHMKTPLEQPYRRPYEITKRISDTNFELDIDGTLKNINVDRLKPAYISKTDADVNTEPTRTDRVPEHQWTSTTNILTKTYIKKKVSFQLLLEKTYGEYCATIRNFGAVTSSTATPLMAELLTCSFINSITDSFSFFSLH